MYTVRIIHYQICKLLLFLHPDILPEKMLVKDYLESLRQGSLDDKD